MKNAVKNFINLNPTDPFIELRDYKVYCFSTYIKLFYKSMYQKFLAKKKKKYSTSKRSITIYLVSVKVSEKRIFQRGILLFETIY